MQFRILSFLIISVCITSCNLLTDKKHQEVIAQDTLDISKVDASPSFKKACKDKIDEERTRCFRKTIHQRISEALSKYAFEVQDTIDEKVTVKLLISAQGKITVAKVVMSPKVVKELPELDSLIHVAVAQLPQVSAAIKKGIPVATEYQLPIQIQLD